jgi:hypothetical protein
MCQIVQVVGILRCRIAQVPLYTYSTVYMSLYSDTYSWLRANQSLFFVRNAVYLAENQQVRILNRWFDSVWNRAHKLPHLSLSRLPLYHWGGFSTVYVALYVLKKNKCYISFELLLKKHKKNLYPTAPRINFFK